MIVYSGTKSTFQRDAINGVIANKIDELFKEFGVGKESYAEFNSWKNSLPQMALIISDNRIDNEVQVAIEYQIPLTSKRVDFMLGGNDGKNDNIVIIELKQWESCKATSRENVVIAFTGGAERDVAHPSQQAYSYAKLIENFNEDVIKEKKKKNAFRKLYQGRAFYFKKLNCNLKQNFRGCVRGFNRSNLS